MTAPNHAQTLKKLAADTLVQTLDEDLSRLLTRTMALARHDPAIAANPGASALPQVLRRWNCVLQAGDDAASPLYRHKTAVALAILLHKYGIADAALTALADAGMDALNHAVALSDDFYRKTSDIKRAFLHTPPTPLKRAPGQPDSLTFYRAGDVVSYQLDGRYHAAYVHRCARTNESPVIEFYDARFDHVPAIEELQGKAAKGRRFNDGSIRIEHLSVAGMKFMPDPAGQIVLIKACVETPPDNSHLGDPVGLYVVSDIFEMQESVDRMFGRD
ncbi:hypothetical protein [Achromobacter deleyi]|uniref:hypothetical protein n=1 Tax=Achromobacter deleyi TaxID=1353891 RepID=UPI001492FCB3|nr:hypothetical protein [Achromobacter deleyi]QVQ24406.1 hypothetical protein HLG70_15980 [Achromobacter deleyi]UIP19938.1 hypothetical protein LYZ39_23590 [Achromobacter deleyi]